MLASIVTVLILIAMPLAGVLFRGRSLAPYMRFPPKTYEVTWQTFSWPVFLGLACVIAAFCFWFYRPSSCGPADGGGGRPRHRTAGRLPWYGCFGVVLCGVSWWAAWTRPEWLGVFRDNTFAPLWFGFILILDGLVRMRQGHSMLSRSPAAFWLLFPVSAVSWWFFEYLNRFSHNWYYSELVGDYSPLRYVLLATPPFATVLPAVLEASELVCGFGIMGRCSWRIGAIGRRTSRGVLYALLVLGCVSLVCVSYVPAFFFPFLWVSPLLISVPLLRLGGSVSPLDWFEGGDRRPAVCLSLGALVCGFFWEMWNWPSLPKWHYSVPYVDRFHVFEMPLLG
jgi:hypothetical protein